MNIRNLSPEDLDRVWHDNVRDHQIGGLTDGISPEVAEDIGFLPPDTNAVGELGAVSVSGAEQQSTADTRSTSSHAQMTWRERQQEARRLGIAPEEVGLSAEERRLLR